MRPSGRNCGHRWLISPFGSHGERCWRSAGGADALQGTGSALGLNTIVPSAFQAPPLGSGARARTAAAPPETSIRLRSPFVKKPRERLSGDQNGSLAPSVS